MNKKLVISFVALCLCFSLSTVTLAYDEMGLYWDLEGSMHCTTAVTTPTNLYVILMDPTMAELGGFEFAMDMVADVAPFILSATFANPQSLDVAPGLQNFIVGFGAPTECTQATLLVTLNILNAAGVDVEFYLHEADPPSIPGNLPVVLLTDDSLLQVVTPCTPYYPCAVMLVNGCGLASEMSTWDSLKSLYR